MNGSILGCNVWRRCLLVHLDVQKDDDTSDIIHDSLLFTLPAEVTFTNHCFSSLLGILGFEKGLDNGSNLFI